MILVLGRGDILSSILNDIKNSVGLDANYSPPGFQTQIIMSINTAFMELNQLGVGPKRGFRIENEKQDWNEFLPSDIQLEGVKTYIELRTRLLFDPPTNSFLVSAIEDQLKELQFRLEIQAEEDGGGSYPSDYTGPYSIIPSFEDQTLETENKTLGSDLTVEKIHVTETSNQSKGRTLTI